MGCAVSLNKKVLKKGGEAPAAKVFDIGGNEQIVGMIAVNIQLIVSLKSLQDSYCMEALMALDRAFATTQKLSLSVVVGANEEIKTFATQNQLQKVALYNDKADNFAKRFGVAFEDGSFCNAFFVVDKEGELKLAKYIAKEETVLDIADVIETTNDWINYKPKGHVHENWMM